MQSSPTPVVVSVPSSIIILACVRIQKDALQVTSYEAMQNTQNKYYINDVSNSRELFIVPQHVEEVYQLYLLSGYHAMD
jgi:hypothetical protein